MEIKKEKRLFDFFDKNNIKYTLYKHQPVFTVEDIPVITEPKGITAIPGTHSKNLFLKDKRDGNYFLVSVTQNKRVDLKELSNTLGTGRFSFGKPQAMQDFLNLEPGSVTPFGLIFDENKKVTFVLDKDFLDVDFINFHPLRNDMNVGLTPEMFLLCMEKLGHKPRVIEIPIKI